VPILTNVILFRRTMHRGPFFMGQTVGMTVNIIAVAWLVFAIVFFSFPYQMPVTGTCCDFHDILVFCPTCVLTITQYQT
jgi:choline transport protein